MTLLETIMALSLAGTIATGAVIATSAAADRTEVTLAQARILEAYRIAQAGAVARGGPVRIVVAADSLVVRGLTGDSAELHRAGGPGLRGVTLAPASHAAVFERNGFAGGLANVTHRLSRGSANRQVIVSRLGRLRAN